MQRTYFKVDEFPNHSIVASHIEIIGWKKGRRAFKESRGCRIRKKKIRFFEKSEYCPSIWYRPQVFIKMKSGYRYEIYCNSNASAKEYFEKLSDNLDFLLTQKS